MNIVDNNLPFEFEQTYKKQKIKDFTYAYNNNFEGDENSLEDDRLEFVQVVKQFFDLLKSYNNGFYKAYLEVIHFCDLENLQLILNMKEKASFFKVELDLKEVNDYISKEIFDKPYEKIQKIKVYS